MTISLYKQVINTNAPTPTFHTSYFVDHFRVCNKLKITHYLVSMTLPTISSSDPDAVASSG